MRSARNSAPLPVCGGIFVLACCCVSPANATDYYVDNQAGDNAASGLTGFPWRTLDKVNNFEFRPGDTLFLRRGQVWEGEKLVLTESGGPGNPITVASYGAPEDPLPTIVGAAPLDREATGYWDFDLHSVNAGSNVDAFTGWAAGATAPSSIKASADTYSGYGVSARLQDAGSGTTRIWRNTKIAMAANLPVAFRLRFKVESGDLTLKIKNNTTLNYYDASGNWGANAPAAVFSASQYGAWSEVTLVVPNDAALGQFLIELRTNGTAMVDEVSLSSVWVEHGPNIYKRAIMSDTVNGVYAVYHGELVMPKKTGVSLLTQDFDWTVETAERALYLYYAGDVAALGAEPIRLDRGAFYAVDLDGTDLVVDGLRVEKTSTGIRARNNDIEIRNSRLRHIGRCGIHVYRPVGSEVVPLYNVTTRNNVVEDSSCGIYYWRVHDSLISGNTLRNIRDRGYGLDIEAMGLQSVTTSVVEHNIGSDAIIGIDLWGGPGYPAFGNVFRYNTMHDIDYTGILMGGTQDDHGITGGPVRGYVYDNLIQHNLFFNNGFGAGYETRGGGMRQNNTPREEDGPNHWYNNTLYANRFNFTGSASFAGNFVFRNNISLAPVEGHLELPGGAAIQNDLASAELSHNIYYPDGALFDWHGEYSSFAAYVAGSQKDLSGSGVSDPMLRQPATDPILADFSLQPGSPAINAGMEVGLTADFAGNPMVGIPDIGAYENMDPDGDGADYPEDCNSADAGVYPGALEVPLDNVDQDCQGGDSTVVVYAAKYSAKRGGELTVEAVSDGGQGDPLAVMGYDPMQWTNKQGGRWTLKQLNVPGNPGILLVTGTEGTIEVIVTD